MLLLHCAAVGKTRSMFCHPIPIGYQQTDNNNRWILNEEEETKAFYRSLPFSSEDNNNTNNNDGIKLTVVRRTNNNSYHSCFEFQSSSSPRFHPLSRSQNNNNTITVYHGTKMDRVWSIMNHGIQSFFDTSLSANGEGSLTLPTEKDRKH